MTKGINDKSYNIVFRIIWILFVVFISFFLYSKYKPYISVPEFARHISPMHLSLKPSGSIGHALGFIGSIMMLLCYVLYYFRKKFECFDSLGSLSLWLEIHIFLGILGPILILFHTSFKFHGILGFAFWCMIIVVISGIFGRVFFGYSFFNISKKYELLHTIDLFIEKDLRDASVISPVIKNVIGLKPPGFPTNNGVIATFKEWRYLKRETNRIFAELDERYGVVGAPDYDELERWATDLVERLREIGTVSTLNLYLSILNKWVIIHKVFSYILFFIMFMHVIISLYWGYSWIL